MRHPCCRMNGDESTLANFISRPLGLTRGSSSLLPCAGASYPRILDEKYASKITGIRGGRVRSAVVGNRPCQSVTLNALSNHDPAVGVVATKGANKIALFCHGDR